MSSISIIPVEILEWVTSVLTTSQQMRLWLCGDRILNLKLRNGGLKRTSLCWPGRTWMPWPRWYFTIFGLEDLKWALDDGKTLCPTLELNLLPKTLKRLHLVCEDVFILLRQQNVNMNDMLPLLQSLYLSGSRLREENLKNLPSSLIELSVTSFDTTMKSSRIFGDLPRHIAMLNFKFNIVDQSELENDLPSNLISLEIYSIECHFNWFSKLPTSLKMLKIIKGTFYPNWLTLPPQLEELTVFRFPTPKSALPQLPQSVKILVVEDIQGITADTELGPLLPKNLTRFVTENYFDYYALQNLPPSLTDLNATVSATHPDTLSVYNPGSVRIVVEGGTFSDQLNLFPFSTKLQFLRLDRINDAICAILPPGLKSLGVQRGLITTEGASKLPKSLTHLSAYFEIFDDDQAMSHIRCIQYLELSFNERSALGKLSELWIHSLLPPSSVTYANKDHASKCSDIGPINQHLTSFLVSFDGYNDYSKICHLHQTSFFGLPQFINLKELMLHNVEVIPSVFRLIPKKVTYLDIDYLTAYPTATHFSMLPKDLKYLSIAMHTDGPDEPWEDETLQSLPRTLQTFTVNGSHPNLTQRRYDFLPPNLWSSRVVDTTPLVRQYGADH